MTWKDILVFADGSAEGLTRARLAAGLAIDENAKFRLCAVAAIPAFAGDSGFLSAVDMRDHISRTAHSDAAMMADGILSALPALAGRVDVEIAETDIAQVEDVAAAMARLADIVVVGQPDRAEAIHLDEALFKGVLFGSGRPCLMFPRWTKPQPWGRQILLAWKDAPEAARAMHDALPLMKRASAVRILRCGEAAGAADANRITEHLTHHGVQVDRCLLRSGSVDVGEAIVEEARQSGADLIVMGGYGHPRWRELILGGATETVVRRAEAPVLFAH